MENLGARREGELFLPVVLSNRTGRMNVFGIFNLNEKYTTFMKPGFEGKPFSNCLPQL